MFSSLAIILLLALNLLSQSCLAYHAVAHSNGAPKAVFPRASIPRPHGIWADSHQTLSSAHSLITAIVPSPLHNGNATFGTMYSIGYHPGYHDGVFGRADAGAKKVFARGVFASDPILTCTPCGGVNTNTALSTNASAPPSSVSCTTSFYDGVFRSSVGSTTNAQISLACFGSGYDGVFSSTSSSISTLPCCFTPVCGRNSSSVMNSTYTGVFRSTTFASNISTTMRSSAASSFFSIASPSSSLKLSTASSTGSLSSSSSGNTSSGSSALSSFSSSSSSAITSVLVISSSTITITLVTFSSSSFSTSSSVQSSSTPIPTASLPNISTLTTPVITGCGNGTGTGILIGTGTVYVAGFIPVASSGTVSGTGTAVGCGTLSGIGTFNGFGVAVGCGTMTGSGTVIGSGTVYIGPGNLIPVVSSGTVTGSAVVVGCGTVIGTGTFTGVFVTNFPTQNSSSSVSTAVLPPPYTSSLTSPNVVQGTGTVTGYGTIYGVGVATGVGGPIPVPGVMPNKKRQAGTSYAGYTGSGSATGIGTAIGFGTASGYGTVVGSGTANGTGTFIGTATAIGSATIIGTGTVLVDGYIPVVSSGTLTGSGTVIGSGTIYGVGTFVGRGTFVGSPGTFTGTGTVSSMGVGFPIPTRSAIGAGTTVNVYVNDCSPSGMPLFYANGSVVVAPGFNSSIEAEAGQSSSPLCNICPEDVGICCPKGVACGGDGHCPWYALVKSGYVLGGLNVVAMANSTS